MAASPTALITGVSGQDGSYLAELLLAKGYAVHGVLRPGDHASLPGVTLHAADLSDAIALHALVGRVAPAEVYNLAAQSSVSTADALPALTFDVTGLGAARLFEAVRSAKPGARVFQAGSSAMFGPTTKTLVDETVPFNPRGAYAIAKVFAHNAAVLNREAYGLYVTNGILFNHESPRRGRDFVTRKIAIAAARIAAGLDDHLTLGDLDARRDWGYAPEYVEAMWRTLQQPEPADYVIATGTLHSVRDFARHAFAAAGLDSERYLRTDPALVRDDPPAPAGDATKARERLGWQATTTLPELARIMVEAEVKALGST